MKKKPTKLTDLSQLSSVISFSKIDKLAYDGEKPNYIILENVVKDFLRDEQGQKAFDKLNKK